MRQRALAERKAALFRTYRAGNRRIRYARHVVDA
jgi:hypothetical protein